MRARTHGSVGARLAAFALGAWLAGCGASQEAKGPPVVRYGQDLCDRCGMVIDDERTAAVARTAGGRELRFDDASELAAFTREDDEPIAQGWVRDWNGGGWVEHDEAVYVHAPDLATPMGSGIVAFVSREAAERFATGHGGQVLTWSDLERR